jgi:hypothetical protein
MNWHHAIPLCTDGIVAENAVILRMHGPGCRRDHNAKLMFRQQHYQSIQGGVKVLEMSISSDQSLAIAFLRQGVICSLHLST